MENVNSLVPVKYLMTRFDWIRLWREEAVKKDCAERKKNLSQATPLQKRIFNQIVLQDA